MSPIKIKKKPVNKLIPYINNAKKHGARQIELIAGSIKEFGFNNPILIDGENGLIAGHGRLLAAQKLGLEEVPTIELSHLTEAQKKAYILADNRLAEVDTEWDYALADAELDFIIDAAEFDAALTGFDLPEDEVQGLTDEDDAPDIEENPITVRGDVWILDNHRLKCGDSTLDEDIKSLMNGQKADMVFTDPPYNIDYQGVSDKRDKIKNDKMSDEDFESFLIASLMGCETMYVCCSWQYAHLFKSAMEKISRKPKAMIVWNKVNPAQNLDKYFKQHEVIFYYGDFGGQKTLRGDIWEIKRQKNTVHPTMKPVELIQMALDDQPDKNIVFDGFGGSGSTIIACQNSKKTCFTMELDERYCDVIVKRWQEYTGKDAVLESNGKTFNSLNG